MIAERNLVRPQFSFGEGHLHLTQYIDESSMRANGYTPSREEQDKEDWQSNAFDNVTRAKLKAFCAGIALQIPEQNFTAVNNIGLFSAPRAEGMKQLVRHSRMVDDNPQMQIFYEAWDVLSLGTVVKYDGYLKTKHKRKFVTGFDEKTGEVLWEEREVVSEDRCIDINVPLSEFFIWSFEIPNVQDQPRVIWAQHYDKDQLETEFGHLPNFKYVKDAAQVKHVETWTRTHYYDKWMNRVKAENDYEVIRYYSIAEDRYEVWCNGVDLIRAPMLWGKTKKRYPFAKTIREPFAGGPFFYGMSLPHELAGNQDIRNALWNTTIDKHIRSLLPPMLVGMANKDLLDLEDEYVNQDNKIYVPDITQVKPMPYEGVNAGDVQMLQMINRALDLQSTDQSQSGIAGQGVTAREIVIADENARKLKGITFMFLEDLWLQKTRNRILTILMNYMRPQYEKVIGEEGAAQLVETLKVFNVKDTDFSDGTKGTLAIAIASKAKRLPSEVQISATENVMEEQGINYKMIAITSDYFDDWEFDFVVQPESIFAQDKVKREALVNEKIDRMAVYFPEYLAHPANKRKALGETLSVYGDSIDQYEEPLPPAPMEGDPNNPLGMEEAEQMI